MESNDNHGLICPECGCKIELTEAISKQLEDQISQKYRELYRTNLKDAEKKAKDDAEKNAEDRYLSKMTNLEEQLTEKEKQIKTLSEKEAAVSRKEKQLAEKEQQYEDKLKEEKERIFAEAKLNAKKEADKEVNSRIDEINSQLSGYKEKLKEAQQNEIEVRRLKNQLEAEKEEFELQKQREIDAAKQEVYKKAKDDAVSEFTLKLRDRDETIKQMTSRIEDLKKKAEQGSQQHQGESQEIELEEILKHNFPLDDIIPVAKGVKGADIIQKVKNEFGFECGTILWESKRHKKFDTKWINKLKVDQRNEKANVAVIISQILPDNISNFGLIDGVYVGSFSTVIGMGCALRDQLIRIQLLKQSEVGKNQKMEALYNYLTSHEFALRMEAIIKSFDEMKKQIETERKVFERQWSAREQILNQMIKNTSGMHGDLKGLIGASLPEVKALEMPLEDENEDDSDLPF